MRQAERIITDTEERERFMKIRRYFMAVMLLLCGAAFLYGQKLDTEAASQYTIYVNRRTNIINVVSSRTGKVVRAMYCSTGRGYSTIRGTYNTVSKMRWHALYGGVYGQYCTRIYGSYLFHSVPYYRVAKNQVETVEYNKLGTQASAGCIRLAVVDAKWIYDNCGLGTRVVIGESRNLQKPTRDKIKISTARRSGWDPTDRDAANPFLPKFKLKKSAPRKLEYGSKVNKKKLKKWMKVSSPVTSGSVLQKYIKVKGKVNTSKPGKYKVTYTVTDPRTLLTKSIKVTFTVKKQPQEPADAAV